MNNKKNAKGKGKNSRRNRITIGIISAIIGGSTAIFGPGIIGTIGIIHLEETINKHFGSGTESIVSRRMNAQFRKKVYNNNRTPAAKGLCGSNVKVACRYSSMSNRSIRNLEKRTGIKVEVDDTKWHLPGKSAVKSLTMPNGEVLDAAAFSKKLLDGDPTVRQAMRTAMKPAVSMWFSKKISNLFKKLGINKLGGFIKENTVAKAREKITSRQRGPPADMEVENQKIEENPKDDPDIEAQNKKANGQNSRAQKLLNSLLDEAGPLEFGGEKINTAKTTLKAVKNTLGSAVKSVGAGVNIVGSVDTACTALNMISMAGYLSKIIGQEQLIKFAMTFLSSVSGLKAGAGTTAGWQTAGEMLFNQDENGQSMSQAFGFMFMTGNWGDPTDTSEFRNGGGLVGDFANFKTMLLSVISGGSATAVNEICNFIQNPFVRVGGMVIGLAAAIFSGTASFDVSFAVSAGIRIGLSAFMSFAVPLAVRMAAGDLIPTETKGFYGGRAVNAITSGSGALFGQNANAQGISVQTKQAAMAFDSEVRQPYLAELQADERAAADPWDIYNPYSLVGSIAGELVPYLSNGSAVSNFVSIGSVALNPLKILTPKASAYSQESYYDVCQDTDYLELNIATDPFCNPVYGLDNKLLAMDPDDVLAQMYEGKHIDEDGAPIGYKDATACQTLKAEQASGIEGKWNPVDWLTGGPCATEEGSYAAFIETCTDRVDPIGFRNEETDGYVRPNDCMVSANKYPGLFYIYTVDDSVDEMLRCVMDEEEDACYSEGGDSGDNGNYDSDDGSDSGDDYDYPATNDQCPIGDSRITNYGTQEGRTGANKPRSINTCGILNAPTKFKNTQGQYVVEVNANIAKPTADMFEAAANSGIKIKNTAISIGFRSYEMQKCIYDQYITGNKGCSIFSTKPSIAANPDTKASNHQMGFAIDIPCSNPANRTLNSWLDRNMSKYGFSRPMPSSDCGHIQNKGG